LGVGEIEDSREVSSTKSQEAILDSDSWRERASGQEPQAQSHRFTETDPPSGVFLFWESGRSRTHEK
jgi:hypothetical protein